MKKTLLVMMIFMGFMVKPIYASEKVGLNNTNRYVYSALKYENFGDEAAKIIKRMENTMIALPVVENINYNFLNEMVVLHSEEIQLSISIQGYSDNPQIIQYANDLLASENGELREMRIVRKELIKDINKPTEGNDKYLNEAKDLAKERFKMLYEYDNGKNPEKDYLNIMNFNNEADIILATNYLKYSDNDIVKKIAQNIINVKREQINKANELLTGLK